MTNFICVFCSFLIVLTPVFSYAQNTGQNSDSLKLVTNLEKGKRAPFSGILLSETSAAKLFADIKFSKKECDALLNEKIDLLKISHKSEKDLLILKRDIDKNRYEGLLSVRDDRIKFLEKNYTPPAWYESGELWFAIGLIAGVGLTVATGYALGQVK